MSGVGLLYPKPLSQIQKSTFSALQRTPDTFCFGGFGLKWYVNLEDPLTHSAVGFDYLDQFLDIEIAPDLSAWNWKDEDELEDAVANGLMAPQRADLIRAEGIRVIETLDKKAPPFDEQWHLWRPDPQWESPGLPAGWDDLNENPARGGDDGP